ncbi:hypothetical protein FAZ69_08450 [Trinickia terrae]|uniref:Uncharacterized protein n=1 Tax=Trinickia terrae TaxID=2571161 RepID=A0A4U1I9K0_9BURK|nr:hypothetical protein FAZ69_08450 [Trinickia terrae]
MIGEARGGQGDFESGGDFRVSSREDVAQHFLMRDPTGQMLSTLHYLGTVEDWVFHRLAEHGQPMREEVRVRLQRLDAVITQYREQIPPDNAQFLLILSWLDTQESLYTLEYLHRYQPEFFERLLEHCRDLVRNDATANHLFGRFMVVLRTRLYDQIFAPDNVQFVARILMEREA